MWNLSRNAKSAGKKAEKKTRRKNKRPFQLEALEPRLLLSADLPLPIADVKDLPGVMPAVVEKVTVDAHETVQASDDVQAGNALPPLNVDGVQIQDLTLTPVSDDALEKGRTGLADPSLSPQGDTAADAEIGKAVSGAASDAGSAEGDSGLLSDRRDPREVIIVDPSVTHYTSVVEALKAKSAAHGSLEAGSTAADQEWFIHVLDSAGDGIEQITGILKSYKNLDAVHLLSHGASGEMSLGATALLHQGLQDRADEISAWGSSLKAGGDILLYGCNIAEGAAGVDFVQTLASLTGADVAASTDGTGGTAAGGDWDLEYRTGEVQASPAFTASDANYPYLMEDVVGTTADDNLTGTGEGDRYVFDDDWGTDTISEPAVASGTDILDFSNVEADLTFTTDADGKISVTDGDNILFPVAGIEKIIGGTGNNTLIGPEGGATWTLTGGDSGMVGTLAFSGISHLQGSANNDTFVVQSNARWSGTIDGGGGTNTLDASPVSDRLLFTIRADGTVGLSTAPDTWASLGIIPAEVLSLLTDGISIESVRNMDKLVGGSGDNTFAFQENAAFAGILDGGTGSTNTLDYSAYAAAVTVNFVNKTATATDGINNVNRVVGKKSQLTDGSGNSTVTGTGSEATIAYSDDEGVVASLLTSIGLKTIEGTPGDDVLTGNDGINILDGKSGDDLLIGGAGSDIYTFTDGWGADTIQDTSGDLDTLDFTLCTADLTFTIHTDGTVSVTDGTNKISKAANIEVLIDGQGNDRFVFEDGATFEGTIGKPDWLDKLLGNSLIDYGSNTFDFSAYTTPIYVDLGIKIPTLEMILWQTAWQADDGDDSTDETAIVPYFSNIDNVIGGSAGDYIWGSSGANVLRGGPGDDVIVGRRGADTFDGGLGDDILYGGMTEDELITIIATLAGDPAAIADQLGISPVDVAQRVLNGETIQSIIMDVIDGDDDVVTYADATGPVTVDLSWHPEVAGDIIYDATTSVFDLLEQVASSVANIANYLSLSTSTDPSLDTSDFDELDDPANILPHSDGAAGHDVILFIHHAIGSNYDDTLKGDFLDNTLKGGAGNDTLEGGLGSDTLVGGLGDDILDGGDSWAGDSTLVGDRDIASYIDATDGVRVDLNIVGAQDTRKWDIFYYENDPVGGLVEGREYEVVKVGDNTFQLKSRSGVVIDLVPAPPGGAHSFKYDGGSISFTPSTPGSIDYATSQIKIIGHGFSTDDVITYDAKGNDIIEGLTAGQSYKVVKVDDNTFTLNDMAGAAVALTLAAPRGTHGFDKNGVLKDFSPFAGDVNYADDTFTIAGHGFSDGDIVTYSAGGEKIYTSQGMGRDTLTNMEGLTGSAYDDVLIGTDKHNVIKGEAGNDFLVSGKGADIVTGGAGSDTISYEDFDMGVFVNLWDPIPQIISNDGDTVTLKEIENVIGSAYDDVLIGDFGNNLLDGGYGNDWLTGMMGSDTYRFRDGWGSDKAIDDIEAFLDEIDQADVIDTVGDWLAQAGQWLSDAINTADVLDILEQAQDKSAEKIPDKLDFSLTTADLLVGIHDHGDVSIRYGASEIVEASEIEVIVTGGGSDTFKFDDGVSFSGTLDGGGVNYDKYPDAAPDVNTLDYSAYTTSIVVDLLAPEDGKPGKAQATQGVYNIHNVIGGSADDTLQGSDGNNLLMGGAGNDLIEGRGGDDTSKGERETTPSSAAKASIWPPTSRM